MSFSRLPLAVDLTPMHAALRTALVNRAQIAALITDSGTGLVKVFRDFDNARLAFPFLTVSLVSAPTWRTTTSVGVRASWDVMGWAKDTPTVPDTLAYEAQVALVDTEWPLTGWAITEKCNIALIRGTQEYNGITFYRSGFTLELMAYRTS